MADFQVNVVRAAAIEAIEFTIKPTGQTMLLSVFGGNPPIPATAIIVF